MILPIIYRRAFQKITDAQYRYRDIKKCHSVFGIKDILIQPKPENFSVVSVTGEHHGCAIEMIKRFYLTEHVLVRARKMDLNNDNAFDEYLIRIFKQGNTLVVKTDEDIVAGICVGFASSPIDAKNLRTYANYRQDPNTKDFLNFTAKLQETPNLWELFNQRKIFEIKMLAVVPEYQRQGLAVMLVDKCKAQARDQGFNVIRMDCINPYDYKVAERCMLQCLVRYPLHKLRGPNAPYIKKNSEFNACVRVYVDTNKDTSDRMSFKKKQEELENYIE